MGKCQIELKYPWVILSHAERKTILNESNEFVRDKVAFPPAQCLQCLLVLLKLLKSKRLGRWVDTQYDVMATETKAITVAAQSVVKWKNKKAWRGAYFPKFNVTVAYHIAVPLANYQSYAEANREGAKETYQVGVDTLPRMDKHH